VAFATPGKKIFIPITETLRPAPAINESLTIANHRKPRELGGFGTMAAGPAVGNSIGKDDVERPAVADGASSRRRLSSQETILLRVALGIALIAAAISITARLAAVWPTLAPLIAITLFIFGLGGVAGAFVTSLRTAPADAGKGARTDIGLIPAQMTRLLDGLPIGIAIWDDKDRLVAATRTYTESLELAPPDVLIGSRRTSIRAVGGRALENVLATGDILSPKGRFDARRRTLPGGGMIEIVTELSGKAISREALNDAEQRIRELVGEVSRLSIQTEDLQAENGALEQMLIEERARTDAAIRARSEFLAHMSHEFRTPLNAILGFADMMRSGIFGPLGHEKYEEYATDIHVSGQQLLDMVTDILDVSQIQSGDVPIERQRIDLQKEIADCLSMLRPRIFASGIALAELVDGLPSVYADPVAVRQILLHILSNAMKFTPTGGRISVKADVAEDTVTIIIDDTGIGISPTIMEKIDQPFASLERDALISGDEGSGLGVGLSVSRALVRLNGGALTIESEEGFGTTVRITLPRK
jgi:two-component system cell cycle sensor histidine kinase PleC